MNTEIIHTIWNRNHFGGGWPYYAIIDRHNGGKFIEQYNEPFDETPGQDRFFTPLLFKGPRHNDQATPPGILFADMDNVRQHKTQLDKIWPHVLWMTSNDNAQAVWFLRSPMSDLDAWADLNQRMTYFMGADKGGWHASKLLRVPESLNWKYDPPQQGQVVSFQPRATPYEAEALRALLPPIQVSDSKLGQEAPNPISKAEWKAHLRKIWDQLPLHVRTDLLAPTMRDRSSSLVRASNKMRHAGISPEDQFQALWWTEWNKFRTEVNRPDQLWRIVSYR